ncbi:hypothetical protein B566_EDAN013256 [Ephemera danica]|nr:hypothetical protein B566_EDAN013256 [Ephemera danica]
MDDIEIVRKFEHMTRNCTVTSVCDIGSSRIRSRVLVTALITRGIKDPLAVAKVQINSSNSSSNNKSSINMNSLVVFVVLFVLVAAGPHSPEIRGYTSRTVVNGYQQPLQTYTVEYVMPQQAVPADATNSYTTYYNPIRSQLVGAHEQSRQKRQIMGLNGGMAGSQAQAQAQSQAMGGAMGGGMMGGFPYGMMGMPMGFPFIGR